MASDRNGELPDQDPVYPPGCHGGMCGGGSYYHIKPKVDDDEDELQERLAEQELDLMERTLAEPDPFEPK